MSEINTFAEMMRQFHETMKVTCEFCKNSDPVPAPNQDTVFCKRLDMMCGKNGYCELWAKKEDTNAES